MNINKQLLQHVKSALLAVPEVRPYLTGAARYYAAVLQRSDETKTADAMNRQIYNRIKELYSGEIDEGDFVDAMANIVQEQLTKAFREALRDNELDAAQVNEEPYAAALEEMILNEFDFVDGLAGDVLEAKQNDTGHVQFQARAEMWARRYDQAYNTASVLIASEEGNNLIWEYDQDKENCSICAALNGIVAKASIWEELGVFPQNPPNPALDKNNGGCGGWQCGCSLTPTDKRQSPKAYDTILNIVTR